MLAHTKTELKDYGVYEIHEAFAGQVLANLVALESDAFAKSNLGRTAKVGAIPADKINTWGGSLSIGHPFGVCERGGAERTTSARPLSAY